MNRDTRHTAGAARRSVGLLRTCVRWALLCAVGLWNETERAAEAAPTEYQLKAVFVYKFATYIRWPAESQAQTRAALIIGIIGDDPFGALIDDVVRGRTVQGRSISVRRLRGTENVPDCDVLFISSSESRNLQRILAAIDRAPVLTVADMDRFAERGGMINLVNDARRIRFEINVRAIDRVGLKAPSQLLRLATIVEDLPR